MVSPPSFPYPLPEPSAQARAFLDPLAARPGGRWVARMYDRHREAPGAAAAPGIAAAGLEAGRPEAGGAQMGVPSSTSVWNGSRT